MGVPTIAIEMASMSNGGNAMESNPLQTGVPTNKIRSSCNHAAAAPPEERTAQSRRVQRNKSIGVAITVETAMGSCAATEENGVDGSKKEGIDLHV